MSKRKQCANSGAHFETEKGYRISKAEHRVLKLLLPQLGFAFQKKSVITDFVVPTRGETTRRMRIENIKSSTDSTTGILCIKGFKNHPIKGRKGKHVRMEDEKCVSPRKALTFILNVMQKLGAPIPFYSKKRWHFQGVYEGLELTITLDQAFSLGRFSGHYMEIETLLPLKSTQKDVEHALEVIELLASHLLTKRRSKISYRKMLMKTWTGGKVKKNKLRKVPRKKLRKAKVNYRQLLKKVSKRKSSKKSTGKKKN